MHTSISRRSFIGQLGAAGALAGGLIAPLTSHARLKSRGDEPEDWADSEYEHYDNLPGLADNPDPAHVSRRGRGWKVLPSRLDDHDNLEWALRNTGKGGVVRLVSGTYKIGQDQRKQHSGLSLRLRLISTPLKLNCPRSAR